jgi:protease-4
MRRRTYILIILLIFFVLITATVISFLYTEFNRTPSVKARSYLEIKLYGPIEEKASPNFFMSFFSGRQPLSMYDIWMNIRKAGYDSRIEGLILRLRPLEGDWGKINEIREAVLEFRKTGKKAYAYIDESYDLDKEYYLATACDEIIFHPIGNLVINGIGGDILFLKNTLDKLGIEAEFEHVEEYKTGPSMFTEEGFTPPHEEMIKSLYDDIYDRYLTVIAQARDKSREDMQTLIDRGFFQGEKALEAGLVDQVAYWDSFVTNLEEEGKKVAIIKHAQYSKIKPSSVGLEKGRKIALIYASGPIHSGEGTYQSIGSATYARWLKRAREDKSISAVVMRVDSPGGTPVASDIIWRELFLTKKAKPVIVSMSDVAGSGGYWISMTAHRIVAHPQTLTASIGVYFGKFNMRELFNKIGISSERIKYGKRSDIFSPNRSWTEEERRFLKNEILWIYDQFITKVAEGRNMTKEEVDKIGKGRVWTGNQAVELGLIDEIGGLTRAIELAKELSGISLDEEVRLDVLPRRVSFFDFLLGRMQARSRLLPDSKWDKILGAFELLEKETRWAMVPLWVLLK